MADLKTVTDVSVKKLDRNSEKYIVNVRISAKPSPLVVTMPNRDIAESLAHLIDGYQMMLSQQPSVWSLRGIIFAFTTYILDLVQEERSMSQSVLPTYERTLSPNRAKIKIAPAPPPVKALPMANGDSHKSRQYKHGLNCRYLQIGVSIRVPFD